jgi:tetratricopeptide (TPR) repeat protein
MNQRLTRKEIKRDEFANAVGRGVEYAESHVRTILLAVGAVVLLGLLALGLRSYLNSQEAKAGEALTYAMKVYEAPIDAAAAKPTDETAPSFASAEARRTRAKELFEQIRDDYGSADAADVAGLYLGQIAAQEGQLDRARELWEDFADEHEGHILAGQAQLNLMELDRQQGKAQELATRLRGYLDQTEPPLPQDALYHELGVTLEQLGQGTEAVEAYQKILDEFPQSPYRSEAQERITVLDPGSASRTAVSPFNLPG